MSEAPRPVPPRRSGGQAERGVAMIWALVSMMLIAGIVFTGSTEFDALDDLSRTEYAAGAQAQAVAEAGVVDAFAWLRRQASQPVTAFQPLRDLDADPEINDTDDPTVGLVRTFEIAPSLWARYTVAHGTPAESFTDLNANGVFDAGEPYTDANGDGRRTPGTGTRDVSSERGLPGMGTVWLLESRANVFRRSNRTLPLGVGPNVQVASAQMATEVRRLAIIPPAAAALCSRRGDEVDVGSRGRVRASTAVAYGGGTGYPDTGDGEVPGAKVAVPGYTDYVEDVFGVDWSMLRSMADISTTEPVEGVPSPIPDFALVVVTGDVKFTVERPLRGTAIVIVQGNCEIESGSNSFFNGVLYVDGDFKARAPTYLRGTVIVTGETDVRGTGGDYCEIEHDPDTVGLLQIKMGQYRYTKSRYVPAPKHQDGRADESITITSALDGLPGAGAGGEAPPGTFQTDDLLGLLEDYLAAHPGGAGHMKLDQAATKLEQARNFLLRAPPQEREAVGKVEGAVTKLAEALEKGADVSSLLDELSGAPGRLFDDMSAMVDRLIGESTADPAAVAAARAEYDAARLQLAAAEAHRSGGDAAAALAAYQAAALQLGVALDVLGG